jgi:hypothetical protein
MDKTSERIPDYKNDHHIVETRSPLCEICIEENRKATIIPIGHIERKQAEKLKQDTQSAPFHSLTEKVSSLAETVSSLTETVSFLQSQLAAVLARLPA